MSALDDSAEFHDDLHVLASMTSALLALPSELLIKILETLDFRSLMTCERVCRYLHSMIAEVVSLQLVVELAAAGMTAGPATIPASERLSLLKKHQSGWSCLMFAESQTLGNLSNRFWELNGGVLSLTQGGRSISFAQLPGHFRGIQQKTWVIEDIGFMIREFGQDPSQNLLVAIEIGKDSVSQPHICYVHLLSLHSGQPHPKAPRPAILELDVELSEPLSFITIVHGEYLGIMIHSGSGVSHLAIWDWTTGHTKMHIVGMRITYFAFLTDKHVMVGTTRREFQLQVFDFTGVDPSPTSIHALAPTCILSYPPSPERATLLELRIRTGPAPQCLPDVHAGVPFHTAEDARLFVVTLRSWIDDTPFSWTHLIPLSTILKQIREPEDPVVPWESWIPHGTRLFDFTFHSQVWVCYVFGQKYVMCAQFNHQEAPLIRVLDFNQRAIRRALDPDCILDVGGTVVTNSSILKPSHAGPSMFTETVTTALPYVFNSISLPADGYDTEIMCSEDGLVVVKDAEATTQFYAMSL